MPSRRPEANCQFRVFWATTMAMSFEWPWQYRFPPFFTLQPNVDTRQKQLAAWCSLVLSFCRLHKQSSMTVMEAQESPLFNNVKLQRKLPVESIQIVLEELRKKGNLEWLDKNKSSFLIMWRRPEEWGKLIYQWVSRSGQNNSVFTLYELTSGEDTEDEEFHGWMRPPCFVLYRPYSRSTRLRSSLSVTAEESSSSSRDLSPSASYLPPFQGFPKETDQVSHRLDPSLHPTQRAQVLKAQT
ncbi:vacuolar protein-sorting-associated protein 25 isoform X1 [Peromyscus leucopus]|uniref:vacuolar protein-sorting-associated protein 25 isoform X1 n=1 Tax=Peromyscus leucopus TaxID=10041 RepID=UPI001884B691|nr:vacuolar protein-sorting-associated protein 25 isoform X1 [Peromyscus leucopus]